MVYNIVKLLKRRNILCRDRVVDQEAEDLAAALAEVASAEAADLEVASAEDLAEVISADLADRTDRTDRTDPFIMAVGITDIITEAAVVSAVSWECL